jgi:hypothetical protein
VTVSHCRIFAAEMHFRKYTSTSTFLTLIVAAAICKLAPSLEQSVDTARVRALDDIAFVRSRIRVVPA